MRFFAVLTSLALLCCSVSAADNDRIISGYAGWVVDDSRHDYDIEKMYLKPMQQSGFTGIDVKLFASKFELETPKQMERLKSLIDLCNKYGLDFHAYATPWTMRRNSDEAKKLCGFVDESGEETGTFCMFDYDTFRGVYEGAIQLAKLSKELGIKSVKIDLEWCITSAPCYGDKCWEKFCAENQGVEINTPAKERHALLKSKQLLEAYSVASQKRMEEVARAFEKEMHGINPELSLGMMPAEDHAFYLPFIRFLATEKAPAIMDSWCMYGGGGYNEKSVQTLKWIREQNSYNIAVPWLRVNYYKPEDLPGQILETLRKEKGYNLWSLSMLRSDLDFSKANLFAYRLPSKYSREDYWKAFSVGNSEWQKTREAIAAGKNYKSPVKFSPVKGIVPECDVRLAQNLKATPYMGEAKYKATAPFVMRLQNVFYVEASPSEPVRFELVHAAADRLPTPVGYAVYSPDGREINSGSVTGKIRADVVQPVTEKGLYAVVINGGDTGPWYRIQVKSRRWGLYGIRNDQPLNMYLFFSGKQEGERMSLYMLPEKGSSEFSFQIFCGKNQKMSFVLIDPDGKETQRLTVSEKTVIKQKTGNKNGAWRLKIYYPFDGLKKGEYVQNVCFNIISGLNPLVSLNPESLLVVEK